MKKLFTIVAVAFCMNINAQYVVIPDANFKSYLQTLVPAAMLGSSIDTTNALVTTTIHSINVSNKSISNLSGIRYFKSLTHLNCSNNPLSSLSVLPNSLIHLNSISCQLTSLPSLPNSLDYLACSVNSIASLPALPATLDTLYCDSNPLTSLPALPNSLIYLYCGNNINLLSLPILPNSLTYLYCAANGLTSLPVLPNSLQTLMCHWNSLTSLPTLPNSLNFLYCYNNSITCFPNFPTSITTLAINPNPFNCLPNYIPALGTNTVTYPICSAGNTNGCGVTTKINQSSENIGQVNVYPNPICDQFKIEANTADKLNIVIYDVNGRQVFSASINDSENINVAILDNGTYTLKIKTTNSVLNKKLIILHN